MIEPIGSPDKLSRCRSIWPQQHVTFGNPIRLDAEFGQLLSFSASLAIQANRGCIAQNARHGFIIHIVSDCFTNNLNANYLSQIYVFDKPMRII